MTIKLESLESNEHGAQGSKLSMKFQVSNGLVCPEN